jgi:predicted exporter
MIKRAMNRYSLFSSSYAFFSSRRVVLFLITGLALLVCLLSLNGRRMTEDLESMLPEEPSDAAVHFRLLKKAPFANKVIIHLHLKGNGKVQDLIRAADGLASAMAPPFFTRVFTGPPMEPTGDFRGLLKRAPPNLMNGRDLETIRDRLKPVAVRKRLQVLLERLRTSGGWGGVRREVREDPLGIGWMVLEKFRHLNPIPRMRLTDNHFVSPDGRSALVLADTDIQVTDTARSGDLLNHFETLKKAVLPPDVEASLFSGHRFSVANAETIKKDLILVFACSSSALILLFILFLRTWDGMALLGIPLATLIIAAAGTFIFFDPVSAVTIGFGSVLLGISVDFGLHVYFGLRIHPEEQAGRMTAEISGPILFSGITTIMAFSVLLLSDLPSQRQLAVFSITGMAAALFFSLIVFPHAVRSRPLSAPAPAKRTAFSGGPAKSRWILGAWVLCLGMLLWQSSHLRFEGDLRSLNLVPEELKQMEARIKTVWGNPLGRAMVFVEGRSLQPVLKTGEALFRSIESRFPGAPVTSLAPVLPPESVQRKNRKKWTDFWSDERVRRTRTLLVTEGRRLGFSEHAFDPFFKGLTQEQTALLPPDFRNSGMGEILNGLLMESEAGFLMLTLVPDTRSMKEAVSAFSERHPDVRYVSPSGFGDLISHALGRDFAGFIIGAAFMVVFLLAVLFRNVLQTLLALIPVGSGLAGMAGGMALLGQSVNLFNIVASILIIGLGVDYGIFMVHKFTRGADLATEKAVGVSGLTTLAGFGALALARHPALYSIGLTVLLGIGAAVLSALWVIPAFYGAGFKTLHLSRS